MTQLTVMAKDSREGIHREQALLLPAWAASALFLLQKAVSQLCEGQPPGRPDSYPERKVLGLQPLEVKQSNGFSIKDWLPACGGGVQEDRALMGRVESRQNETQ